MIASRSRSPQVESAATRVSITHARFATLGDDQAHTLFEELMAVAMSSVTEAATRDLEGRRRGLLNHASVYMARADGRIVGFVIYRMGSLVGRPSAHLVAACLLPEYQGRGVASALNARIVLRLLRTRPFSPVFVVAHIMNPVALEGWRSRIRNRTYFYPRIAGSAPPNPTLVAAALEFATEHDFDCNFDLDTGVVHGRLLPGSAPKARSKDPSVNQHFDSWVDPERGDALLMVVDGGRRMILTQVGELCVALSRVIGSRLGKRSIRQ